MSTKKLVQWEGIGSYRNLEIFMEQAKNLRSRTVGEMIGNCLTRMGRAFGNLTASRAKKMRSSLPTAGEARTATTAKVQLMRTNVSGS